MRKSWGIGTEFPQQSPPLSNSPASMGWEEQRASEVLGEHALRDIMRDKATAVPFDSAAVCLPFMGGSILQSTRARITGWTPRRSRFSGRHLKNCRFIGHLACPENAVGASVARSPTSVFQQCSTQSSFQRDIFASADKALACPDEPKMRRDPRRMIKLEARNALQSINSASLQEDTWRHAPGVPHSRNHNVHC